MTEMKKTNDYTHNYRAVNNYPSWCRIRIYETKQTKEDLEPATYVICTEPPEPSGNSVTNSAAQLAAEVMHAHQLSKMVWIKHYDREGQLKSGFNPAPDQDYSLVTFTLDEPHDRLISGRWHKTLGTPSWKHLADDQIENLLGSLAPHVQSRIDKT